MLRGEKRIKKSVREAEKTEWAEDGLRERKEGVVMIQSIKKQMKVSIADWGLGLAFTAGCVVFGLIFIWIMKAAGPVESEDEALITMAFGIFGAGIFIILYMGFTLLMNFNLQVGMGCTRKDFIVSYYVTGALGSLVLVLFVAVTAAAEQMVYTRIYGAEAVVDMVSAILKWGIPAALALPAVSSMCGALVLRFGKAAAWILWGIWMFGCLGLPRMADKISELPDSALGKAGTAAVSMLKNLPGSAWTILILLAGAVSLAVEVCLLLRQEVQA